MKALYDTCVYIDYLRETKRADLFSAKDQIRFLSPIVMMELVAGVRGARQSRTLDQLFAPYLRASRIVHLETKHYYKAGNCISKLGVYSKGISNDILIALSASAVGATLFTSNKADFDKLRHRIPLKVEFV